MTSTADEMLVWVLRTLSDAEREGNTSVSASVEADRAVLAWTVANLNPERLEPVLRIVAARWKHCPGYVAGWAPDAICTPPRLVDNCNVWCGLAWGHGGRHFPGALPLWS